VGLEVVLKVVELVADATTKINIVEMMYKNMSRGIENVIFWVVAAVFIFIILYLFISGRAFT
tara:strand:- start:4408 stop:4593 length:186 start_codon:yes stop_codon:yes gene_type:complete